MLFPQNISETKSSSREQTFFRPLFSFQHW